ncbi:MAG: hypothetical protein BME93_04420 [Methanosarcinales archaeon Met12]|nr:MAG: hypothetical protein BME93_04420 [Methanosarcinales archaeon Met12]
MSQEVFNVERETRSFRIVTDQIVNVTWQIDGAVVQTNESVISANLTIDGQIPPGNWNVSTIVENPNGTDIHTWVWYVVPYHPGPPKPLAMVRQPDHYHISNTVGETRTFSVSLEDTYFTVYWIMTDAYALYGEVLPFDFQNHPGLIRRDVNVSFSQIDIPATTIGEFSVMAVLEQNDGSIIVTSWFWEIKSPPALSQPLYFGAIVGVVGLLLIAWLMRRLKN